MKTTKKKSFKRLFAFLMAFVMVTALAANAVFAADTFKDVKSGDWFYDSVESLAKQGIVQGYSTTSEFRPNNNLNRQEAAKMIGEAAGLTEPSVGFVSKLTDLDKASDWAVPYIKALEEAGVVKGFGATNEFRPQNNIKRGHVAKMVAIAFDIKPGNVDVDLTDIDGVDNEDYIRLLASNGIVKGYKGTDLFKPDQLITRAEFAKIIDLSMKLFAGDVVNVKSSTTNSIQGLVGESTKLPATNVVILGTDAEITAVATNAKGYPVANAKLLFTITGAKAHNSFYDVEAQFTTGQNWVEVITNSKGKATVKIHANVCGPQQNSDGNLQSFAYRPGAASEVEYNVSYNGDVKDKGATSFATIKSDFFTEGNFDPNSPTVEVSPEPDPDAGDDFESALTFWLAPYHQDDGSYLFASSRYASSNEVSKVGDSNKLHVSAPYLGLNIKSRQFIKETPIDSGYNKDLPLSYGVNNLKPNQIDIYEVPGDVKATTNFATLNFGSMGLSPGSAVTVYFVPTAGTVPTKANTSSAGVLNSNGAYLSGGIWAKTYYATPAADVDQYESLDGTVKFYDEDFALQLPLGLPQGKIYVILSTPGQIDPATDVGYSLRSLTLNYGGLTDDEDPTDFDTAPLQDYIEWETYQLTESDYTSWFNLAEEDLELFLEALDLGISTKHQKLDSNWTYQYKLPAYPLVGNAVVRARDGNNVVQLMWTVPTRNTIANQNMFRLYPIKDGKSMVRPLTEEAAFRNVGEIVKTNADGSVIIDSAVTGHTALKAVLNLDQLSDKFKNTLVDELYAFAQWTPSPSDDAPTPDEPIPTIDIVANQYTLAGQKVEFTAIVRDANGNLVESGIPVDFTIHASKDQSITVWEDNQVTYYTVNPNQSKTVRVNTNTNGVAKLYISAADMAAAVVEAEAKIPSKSYDVELFTQAGPIDEYTQINFGSLEFSYIPENPNDDGEEFEPIKTGIQKSKVVVGNLQKFGIVSKAFWPGKTNYGDGLVPSGYELKYVKEPLEPVVYDVPLNVTGGKIEQLAATVGTDEYITDKAGNRHGMTHFTAYSEKAGIQNITVAGKNTADAWTNLSFEGVSINAGYGVPAGLNSFVIPVQWMAGVPTAVVTTSSTVVADYGSEVDVSVLVKDKYGNPVEGAYVKFGLNYDTGSAEIKENHQNLILTFTDADGKASATVINGIDGEKDQVAITVVDKRTGTDIKFDDGKLIGSVIIQWNYTPEGLLVQEVEGIIGSGKNADTSAADGWTALGGILGGNFTVEQTDWVDPVATMKITKGGVSVSMKFNIDTSSTSWFIKLAD